MPMIWNAEADAKLLSLILNICDVKVPAATLKQIAGLMGNDCTPKALTHRIAKFRNAAAVGGVVAGGKSASAGPGAGGGKAGAGAGKGKGGGRKRGIEEVVESIEGGADGIEDADDEEVKGEVKKVKVEAKDEGQEGMGYGS